jgi:hypothetical protein
MLQTHCLGLAAVALFAFCRGSVADAGMGQQPLASVETFADSYGPAPAAGQLYEEERQRLLQRIGRSSGRWDSNHPRWRLLEALHGFDRYRDVAGAESDCFEGLFQHVPAKHKKVCHSPQVYTCSDVSRFSTARSSTIRTLTRLDLCSTSIMNHARKLSSRS